MLFVCGSLHINGILHINGACILMVACISKAVLRFKIHDCFSCYFLLFNSALNTVLSFYDNLSHFCFYLGLGNN